MLTRTTIRKRLLSTDVTTPPAAEPMTTAEAKAFLRFTGTTEDTLIDSMVKAARVYVENQTHRALITQTVRTMWAASDLPLRILRPPVQSLSSVVTVYQSVETDEDEADFYVFGAKSMRPELRFKTSGDFAATSIEEVWISTVNGYGAASAVPQPLVDAVKRVLKVLFDYRNGFSDQSVNELPVSIDDLISDYIVPVL